MTGLGSQQIPGGLTERQTKARTNLRARVWSPELLGTGSLPAVCSWQPQLPKPLEALGALGPPDLDFSPSSNAIQGAASGQLPPSLRLSCILRESPELQPPSPAAGLRNTPPAAAQPSYSSPARPRNLETERKHPMPPRSTQSVLGSTPPPNLSDSAAKPGNVSAHMQRGTEGSAPTRDGHRNGGRRAAKLQQTARPARQSADRTPRCSPERGYRPACERRVCANVAAGRTPTPVSGVWVPAGLPPYHTHLGKCL